MIYTPEEWFTLLLPTAPFSPITTSLELLRYTIRSMHLFLITTGQMQSHMPFTIVVTENSYRLRVPKYGAYFEFVNFGLLLFTYILCLSSRLQFPFEITKPYHLQIAIEPKLPHGK